MTTDLSQAVTVQIGATTAALRYVRVIAATVADDAGFDVQQIEKLRLAVDELCALALDIAEVHASLEVHFRSSDGFVEMVGVCSDVTGEPFVDAIACRVLEASASTYEIRRNGDHCYLRLELRG